MIFVIDPRDEFVDTAIFELSVGISQELANVGGNADYFVAS